MWVITYGTASWWCTCNLKCAALVFDHLHVPGFHAGGGGGEGGGWNFPPSHNSPPKKS